ncbi:hypothetical protein H0H92_004886 [Tricholoma furcatifolium]|nr:hypothetical protein H0H92_004886 [Tricholoma furcatifolium]
MTDLLCVEALDGYLGMAHDLHRLGRGLRRPGGCSRGGAAERRVGVGPDPLVQREHELASEFEAAEVLEDREAAELVVPARGLVRPDGAHGGEGRGEAEEEVCCGRVESGRG